MRNTHRYTLAIVPAPLRLPASRLGRVAAGLVAVLCVAVLIAVVSHLWGDAGRRADAALPGLLMLLLGAVPVLALAVGLLLPRPPDDR